MLRAGVRLLMVAALAALAWILWTGRDLPIYEGPVSDHFGGERFRNLVVVPHGSMFDFLKMRLTTPYATWPQWLEIAPAAAPGLVPAGEVRATFVNHATVLLQLGEVSLLTDPTWSWRASPLAWAGPRRVHPPGIRFEELPAITAALVSHTHYDHLDLATLRRLTGGAGAGRGGLGPRVVAGLGVGSWLERQGVRPATELDWWQSVALTPEIRVTFVPVQHWSGRRFRDRERSLWGGFVIEYRGRTIFFAGDTAAGPQFRQIRERFGDIDLALLPIGAYAPPFFMSSAHLDPEQAVAAHSQLGAGRSMAVHFGCFQLSQEARDEPGRRLAAARQAAGLAPSDFVVPEVGETFVLAAAPPPPKPAPAIE